MPALRFPQYLKKHGLYLFIAADETYLPGSIFEKTGEGFWPLDDLRRIFEEDELDWELQLVKANIPGVIKGKSKVGAQGELKLPFLTIQGGLEHKRYVDFSIGFIRKCIFIEEELRLWNPLRGRLRKLKKNRREVWDSIKGHYLVRSAWYATKYSVNLGRAWKGGLSADLKKKIFPHAEAEVNINPETKVVDVSWNLNVPFAFHGKRLVRI